jgi:hypothetical protein
MAPNLSAKPCAGRVITALSTAAGLSAAIRPQSLTVITIVIAAGTILLVITFITALFGNAKLSSRAFRLIRLYAGRPGKRD